MRTASGWPMTDLPSSASSPTSRARSDWDSRPTGMPVFRETTGSSVSSVTAAPPLVS